MSLSLMLRSVMMRASSADSERLLLAGWRPLLSGKWTHPQLPPVHGRRRPFSAFEALTLLDAVSSPISSRSGVEEDPLD